MKCPDCGGIHNLFEVESRLVADGDPSGQV